jgi:arylsulfatase A-like enzyme
MYDDLGYADLGCYGQRHIQTPFSDRLAADGTRFTDCYAGGAVCAPSRSVLMTGLHTGHTPVRANAGTVPLQPSDFTVAELLKSAGYATGGFGKWGLGDADTAGAPHRQGFDEFFGYLHQTHAHNYYTEFLRRNDERVALSGNENGGHKQYSSDLIAERALDFVKRNREKPFFLYATYTLPHAQYNPPSDAPYSDKPWSSIQKNVAAMITRADRHLGDILSLLRDLRLEENTVVFCTSDNGGPPLPENAHEMFRRNGPLRSFKGEVYEGGIRVPMIVRWPGVVKAGRTSDLPWSFCDVLPTFADIAGVPPPKNIDGTSIVSELRGKATFSLPRWQYWEQNVYNFEQKRLVDDRMQQAARRGEWKAVRPKPSAPMELYNLKNDIGETTDVAAREPRIAKEMEAFLKQAHTAPRAHDNGSRTWKTT